MSTAIPIVNIDLSQPLTDLTPPTGHRQIRALIRFRHKPLGWIDLPVVGGVCSRETLAQAIVPHYSWHVQRELAEAYLQQPARTKTWDFADLVATHSAPANSSAPPTDAPLLTVAYCCADRQDVDWQAALAAIAALDYPALQVLIVEALPIDAQIAQAVERDFPRFQYQALTHPSLNAARNWAIRAAQGEYIAFLDGATRPEPEWARAIVQAFAAHPQIPVIAGLSLPDALPTAEHRQFAKHYARERGFERRYYHWDGQWHWSGLGTGQIGNGGNLACRRSLFATVGDFDLALDIPGQTGSGGDHSWFIAVLRQGLTILYDPSVVAQWHLPRHSEAIQRHIQQQHSGFYSYLQQGISHYPTARWAFFKLGLWQWGMSFARLIRTYGIPRAWSRQELRSAWHSWKQYAIAQRRHPIAAAAPLPIAPPTPAKFMAIRTIDLDQPLPDFTDIADYQRLRVFLQQGDRIWGQVNLKHDGAAVSAQRLAELITMQQLWLLLSRPYAQNHTQAQAEIERYLYQYWLPPIAAPASVPAPQPARLPLPDAVSIIIPTCDRPEDLTRCLNYLRQQQTPRQVEIIVCDNRPQSGITPPVIEQFPEVTYVTEPRAGASYARNRAIAATHHPIIVMIDDDVVIPSDWLEKLLTPFARPEIAAVTGNVLPIELDSAAQWICEDLKGGLSAGWQAFEVDRTWLDSFTHAPPMWEVGVSANAAFRASLFADPKVGLMNELLGPGTPCGAGEEMYLFYRILRAGYTLRYEPSAHVWHRHRQTLEALRKQQHAYMQSACCFQLLVWEQDGDHRALPQLLRDMPRFLFGYLWSSIIRQNPLPRSVVWAEFWGYWSGFWAYYKSKRRVARLGRSAPYIPPALRESIAPTPVPAVTSTLSS
jgi:O-antigen biosynthesis protein